MALPPPEPRRDIDVPENDAARSLRAQLLATEHWSLLASRSTTQSEVLFRIAIFLTLLSASLVTLGLLGQATQFQGGFRAAALVVLVFLVTVGTLTQIRLISGSTDDLAYVIGMNRLRGAYIDLDPGMEPYLLASPYDDEVGIGRTYFPYHRSDATQVMGSSGFLLVVVNSIIFGVLSAYVGFNLAAPTALVVGMGVLGGTAFLTASMTFAYRAYNNVRDHLIPLKVTPPEKGW